MDRNGVLAAIFDQANNRLGTTDAGAASAVTTGGLDENGVWAHVYDEATNTIRTVSV